MNKRKIIMSIIVLTLIIIGAIGCAPATTEEEPIKVALLVLGRIDDLGWDQRLYEGLVEAEEKFNIETAYAENVPFADTETFVRDYASRGYDLVIAGDFPFIDAVFKVADEFPETWFAWAGSGDEAPNVVTFEVHAQECAYLAGMLAAHMSETGHVAGVKGYDVPDIIRDINGYKLGARAVNPDIKVTDVFTFDWQDPVKAKDATLSLISEGADVFYVDGNPKDEGVFAAAEEYGGYVIGSVGDQYQSSPETVLVSVMYNHPENVVSIIESYIDGTIESGTLTPSMKDGGCYLSPYHDFEDVIPDEVKAEIDQARQDILDGTLVVPDTVEMIE